MSVVYGKYIPLFELKLFALLLYYRHLVWNFIQTLVTRIGFITNFCIYRCTVFKIHKTTRFSWEPNPYALLQWSFYETRILTVCFVAINFSPTNISIATRFYTKFLKYENKRNTCGVNARLLKKSKLKGGITPKILLSELSPLSNIQVSFWYILKCFNNGLHLSSSCTTTTTPTTTPQRS
jgi:hypothetical protein